MDSLLAPFFELDHAVICVGQATAHVAAQEGRVAFGRRRGDDTAQSERS